MKNKITIIVIGLIAVGLLIYVVNKPGGQTQAADNSSAKAISPQQVMDSLPRPAKKYKIGVLFPMLAAPFWVNESYGVLDQAKKIGVDVVWYSADGYTNVDKQNSQVEDLITQKVDAILIAPTSLMGNTPAIEKAIANGIKVFVHVTGSSAKGISCSVLADDKEIGREQAEYTVNALQGKGKVIMLTGPDGADWSANRAAAYKAYLAQKAKDIVIVAERSGEPEKVTSQKIIEELLVKFNDIDAIYTAADGMAIGVTEVLNRVKTPKKIILTTASFSKESLSYIQKGQISLNVDESPVFQGRSAVNAVIYGLEGYKLPATIFVPVPGIDKKALDNIDLMNRWAPDGYSPSN